MNKTTEHHPDRGTASRPRVRRATAITAAVAALGLLAACSSEPASPDSSASADAPYTGPPHSTTLKLALTAMDPPMDPATYYGGPAFNIMDGIYDGLVKYEVGSVKLEPDIAESWTISPDGKTYTFKLKPGLKYHDGTPVDAASIQYAFQRFKDIGSSPSYMLAQLESMEAPDPTTFVMHLTSPVDPMLDYLASFVGPKAMSTALIKEHAGTDDGQTWLGTHDAGSGPYEMTGYVQDQSYTLKAFDGYQGTKPYYTDIDVSIIPDVTTQVLQLQKGDLDVISTALPANILASLQDDPNLNVKTYEGLLKVVVWAKQSGFMAEPGATDAVNQAINREIVTQGAYGMIGKVSTDLDLKADNPDGTNDTSTYDAAPLTAMVKEQGTPPSITLGYANFQNADKLAAELVQTQLQATGLEVTLRPYGFEFFDFVGKPEAVPDLFLLTTNADAASSGTWLTMYFATHGPLVLNSAKNPEADELLLKGITSPTHEQAVDYYKQASDAYKASGDFFTIADLTPSVVSQKSVGEVMTTPANPFSPMLAETRP